MSFINLITASFFAGFGLGYLKFYGLEHLTFFHGMDSKSWVIQGVGALITLGPCLIYFLSSPLASSYKKRWVMFAAAGITAVLLVFGGITDYIGTAWTYVFLAGLIMGCFNAAKNAAIPLEAVKSGRSTESVNAAVNIGFLAGMMLGVPIGTKMYEVNPAWGLYFCIALFVFAALFGSFCHFSNENLQNFRQSTNFLCEDTRFLIKKYKLYLLMVPLIWGVVSALSLSIIAYAEEAKLGTATQCSFMAIYAAVAVAVGNVMADKLKKNRYHVTFIYNILLIVFILLIPVLIRLFAEPTIEENRVIYWILAAVAAFLGILFGLSTNLIEAEWFRMIYEDKKEGAGAALMSAAVALACFVLGTSVGVLLLLKIVSPESQFLWLALISALIAYLTKVWKDNAG
ncbi:MAG: MFS transporter [Syntrophobacterales bacterium]|jgi:MFS family permease|nr:MFS transporter [Syntrophobacterales bacterium]